MNIIMILCDELRAAALGFMGNDIIKTPNIDALAEDSVIFENSYCNTPMCVPSRVSIATGRHALSHGAMDNMLSPFDDEISIYHLLKEQNYHTFNHGKWHCNIDPDKFGVIESRGGGVDTTVPEKYVTCFGITDRETRMQTNHKRNYGEVPLIIYGTRPSHKDDTLDSVVTKNFLADVEKIDKDGQPVFARLSIMDPHTPYIPSEPYASMYNPDELPLPDSYKENLDSKPILQRYFHKVRGFHLLEESDYRKSKAAYYGLVSHVDERVGLVIDKLKALDLYDDSLVIFTSDHGSMMGEHGYIEKWGHMYESVMRTPLLIKLPKNQHGGKRLDSFVESIDVMPTILDLLNMPIPENVHGNSLLPYMNGEVETHKDEVYAQYYCGAYQNEPALMVRDARWKLTSYPEGNKLEGYLMNDHPLKMTDLFSKPPVLGELYDMEKDPEERINLFDHPDYEEIKRIYLKKLDTWTDSLDTIANTHTMLERNNMSLHIVTQGENMSAVQEIMYNTGRLRQLKKED